MSQERMRMIEERLRAAFSPTELELQDDSAKHAGHAGARGGGHFQVRIKAGAFAGKSTLERHRMVYAAVSDLMNTEIHALSIKALPPDQG